MSKFHKNTGALGQICVNSICITPTVKSALQKISYKFPIGISDIHIIISKTPDGEITILRGASLSVKNPLAHGGPEPTILKNRIVDICEDIVNGLGAIEGAKKILSEFSKDADKEGK